jgi:hypothetical protein
MPPPLPPFSLIFDAAFFHYFLSIAFTLL